MRELADRLTDLSRLGGKDEHVDGFTREYARLLAELTAAMETMKELAVAQGRWLQGEAGKQARVN
jgi:hypothetical protein